MRTLKIIIFFAFCCHSIFSQNTVKTSAIIFTENKGQVHNQHAIPNNNVLFSGSSNELVYHLKNNGISYQLSKPTAFKLVEGLKTKQKIKYATQTTIYRVDVNWLNANKNCSIQTGQALNDYTNYYNAACPNGVTDVKSYETLLYKNLYEGIDLKWYSKQGNLKYDFIVQPNANPNSIQLQINGAQSILITKNGELHIKTPLGTIVEQAPIAYQGNTIIKTKWILKNNCASFLVENYNKQLPLIIDPALRIWGTYYGGALIDYNYGCTTDASGNVFNCGYTQSNTGTNIATTGSYQSSYAGGTNDAYLAKFTTNGLRLWSTYYGGATLDVGSACAIDNAGNVYMSGYTDSNTGIATIGAHQPNLNGNVDAFLVKFTTNGARIWATYYGGTLNNYGYFCATDVTGNVFLSGNTSSTSGTDIATPASHQPTHGGSTWDGFIVKFNSFGVRQWGTYYGGFANEYAYNCATDASGNVYFVGRTYTNTGNSIATVGCHQVTHGGNQDAFIVKFNSAGVRQWGTYYGGFNDEYGYGVAVDSFGNVYLSGSSDSVGGTIIATSGSAQPNNGGGFADAFIVKFNSAGVRLWGTYYGDGAFEEGLSCAIDGSNNVYLAGQTGSSTGTVIATPGAHQAVFGGGNYDAYLVKFNANGTRQWGTYYGEIGDDYALVCAVDNSYNIYIGGRTSTNTGNNIASPGAHQVVYGGGNYDGFLAKFFECQILSTDIFGNNITCNGQSNGSATVSVSGGSGFTYSWVPSGGNAITANNLAPATYSCIITNSCGSTATETILISQPNILSLIATSSNSILCNGNTATLTAIANGGNGSYMYTWSTGALTNTTTVSPTTNTNYTLSVTDFKNCTANAIFTQSVGICTEIKNQNAIESGVHVFPNPTNDLLTVDLENINTSFLTTNALNTVVNIILINTLGQTVINQTDALQKLSNTKQQLIINTAQLVNGLYILKIEINTATKIIKIIKE